MTSEGDRAVRIRQCFYIQTTGTSVDNFRDFRELNLVYREL